MDACRLSRPNSSCRQSAGQKGVRFNMSNSYSFMALLGCIISVYVGLRIFATIVDAGKHLYHFWDERRVNPAEEQVISRLSFWRDCENIAQVCRDSQEYPLGDEAATMDLDKLPASETSGIKNLPKSVERGLRSLFARYKVAHLVKVVRTRMWCTSVGPHGTANSSISAAKRGRPQRP